MSALVDALTVMCADVGGFVASRWWVGGLFSSTMGGMMAAGNSFVGRLLHGRLPGVRAIAGAPQTRVVHA